MPARRANPQRVKLHRSYSVPELATCLGVHKNTVRHWQGKGLKPVDTIRPLLFHGADVRAFLAKGIASRKRPCAPGTLYCFKCRQPRAPALGMLDYTAANSRTGNLSGLCDTCSSTMHRRIRLADLPAKMPGLDIQHRQASPSISSSPASSLNCDFERQVKT